MELNRLYRDTTVLIGRELPLYAFILYADMGARDLLCRYPAKIILPVGEYTPPEGLEDSLPFAEEFYPALLSGIAARAGEDAARMEQSRAEADKAYLALWKKSASGKRLKGDRW